MEHAEVVDGGLFEATEDPAEFFQPADEAFDHVAAAIGFAVEVGVGFGVGLVSFLGDDRFDSVQFELFDDGTAAIGLVTRQGVGLDPILARGIVDLRRFPQLIEQLSLVSLTGAEFKAQRQSVPFADCVDFRGESPPRATERMIRGFFGIPFFPPPAAHR